jgi:trans-aconitate methyltransferase
MGFRIFACRHSMGRRPYQAGAAPDETVLSGWVRRSPVLSIEAYTELLYQNGEQEIIVFEKVYPHLLANADALADWASDTALGALSQTSRAGPPGGIPGALPPIFTRNLAR